MSLEPQNSDDAQQICSQLLEEIANDDELRTLTEEEIKAIFGGLLMKPMYGVVIPPRWIRPMYGLPRPRFFQ